MFSLLSKSHIVYRLFIEFSVILLDAKYELNINKGKKAKKLAESIFFGNLNNYFEYLKSRKVYKIVAHYG